MINNIKIKFDWDISFLISTNSSFLLYRILEDYFHFAKSERRTDFINRKESIQVN
jgi:hypothetical protein